MQKIAAARPSGNSHHLASRMNIVTRKVVSGSRYFGDTKHQNSKVVVEMDSKNTFKIYFMSEDKKQERLNPKSFTRAELQKMLTEAKGGIVEITINKAIGYVKAVCLKKYLADTLKGI